MDINISVEFDGKFFSATDEEYSATSEKLHEAVMEIVMYALWHKGIDIIVNEHRFDATQINEDDLCWGDIQPEEDEDLLDEEDEEDESEV